MNRPTPQKNSSAHPATIANPSNLWNVPIPAPCLLTPRAGRGAVWQAWPRPAMPSAEALVGAAAVAYGWPMDRIGFALPAWPDRPLDPVEQLLRRRIIP